MTPRADSHSVRSVAAVAAAAWLAAGAAPAATITVGTSWTVGSAIPDNNSSGLASVRTVTVDIASIDSLTVSLEISGGWNGDYYAYLLHDSGFSVLLNRPGRTTLRPAGSASSGMTITVADAASQELHAVPDTGGLAGEWQPDGRYVDPGLVLETSPRTALLDEFAGLDPNGTWSLFVADLAAGDQGVLVSWGLAITGEQIPEPAATVLTGVAVLLLPLRRQRRGRPQGACAPACPTRV